jgi:hypothetical protein
LPTVSAGWRRTEKGIPVADLDAVHDRLRQILAPYRGSLVATKDGPGGLTLEIAGLEGKPWGYVAGTRVGKRYVSYYLMPIYGSPGLLAGVSPTLKRRMQGKACFNFTTIDEELLAELAELTKRGIAAYRDQVPGAPVDARGAAQRSR